jgi:hypothetical protein
MGRESKTQRRGRMDTKRTTRTNTMNWIPIGTMETTSFLSKSHNWKSPENDLTPNY